ncbi:MAG: 6-carboxytetrahydropterin synthase QueD [Clostridia bacterium]|nr:6-carboxytetrahydropterin synthase QueD [Clostridia bacterium]NCC42978.1 6-carboxytetrahydropterin synthase QueD [Clostridia bacterium]
MYILKTEHSFDSAHFLAGYDGKCSNIHGHRWRVVLEVQTDELCTDDQYKGMYVDFGDLKNDLKQVVDHMDHALIIEKGSLKELTFKCLEEEGFRILQFDFRPTAENMAKYFYDTIQDMGYHMRAVTVYETPNNAATYMKGN